MVQEKIPATFVERALELAFKHTGGTAEELLLPENAEALVASTSAYVELWGAYQQGLREGGPKQIEDADSLLLALTAAGVPAEGDGASAWLAMAKDDAVTFEAFAQHVQRQRTRPGQPDVEVGVKQCSQICAHLCLILR